MKIDPAASIEGAIAVPGVKGISQRAVLLGAIADGESRIDGFGRAADTETALSVVRQLGAEFDDDGSETILVRGVGLRVRGVMVSRGGVCGEGLEGQHDARQFPARCNPGERPEIFSGIG